jgi:hypothetical protein
MLLATGGLLALAWPVIADSSGGRVQSFHSLPHLHPPAVGFSQAPDPRPGDFLITPNNAPQNGPMILDSRGQLVWFLPLLGESAFNLEVQRYQGQPVLTWWQGKVTHGQGEGEDVIMNRSYQTVAVLHAGHGYTSDLHEFQITPRGTALIESVVPVTADLRSVGGPRDGRVYDGVIQEVDIGTGAVLWEWHSLNHIPISGSYAKKKASTPYDYFHLNSIQQLPGGNLLVSARNMWAVYKINRATGKVMWKLGGRGSNFHMGSGTGFEWQHDSQLKGDVLTVFDDGSFPTEEQQSSAKTIRIDFAARRAVLVRRYTHQPPLLTGAMGSAQHLSNGDLLVDWGDQSHFSEYTADGHQLFDGALPLGINSYRAYRFPWIGRPRTSPALAASAGSGTTLYASWNGATQVAAWRIFTGASPGAMSFDTTAPRRGFETTIWLRSTRRYFRVQAIDAAHRVLGTSPVITR